MFKKSKSEKYNNKKSRQRKLKAFEISAFVMMLLALFAGMAFLAAGYLFFSQSGDPFDFLFCACFKLHHGIVALTVFGGNKMLLANGVRLAPL